MSVFNINNIPRSPTETDDKPLIMLIDDEVENINVLGRLLDGKYNIITCLGGYEALDHINTMAEPEKIQLIISDQRMPRMTGVEFFEQIIDKMPDVIRIILTGYSDTQSIIDSVNKARLYKFITKPFNPGELSLTVQRGIESYQMQQKLVEYTHDLEQKVKERTQELELKNRLLSETLVQLEKTTLTDPLTGAHNRRFVSKMIPGELAKLQREHFSKEGQAHLAGNLGLISMDIDHFKTINDNYGHEAGDKVLIQFVEVLTTTCRGADWVVRWGGEEFLLIVRFLKREELHHLAERLRSNIANYEFDLGNGQSLHRTCSMGITAIPFIKEQYDAISWEQALNLADVAMYAVKNSSRNGWLSLFETAQTDGGTFYQQAVKDLKSLIDQGQVEFTTSLERQTVKF